MELFKTQKQNVTKPKVIRWALNEILPSAQVSKTAIHPISLTPTLPPCPERWRMPICTEPTQPPASYVDDEHCTQFGPFSPTFFSPFFLQPSSFLCSDPSPITRIAPPPPPPPPILIPHMAWGWWLREKDWNVIAAPKNKVSHSAKIQSKFKICIHNSYFGEMTALQNFKWRPSPRNKGAGRIWGRVRLEREEISEEEAVVAGKEKRWEFPRRETWWCN